MSEHDPIELFQRVDPTRAALDNERDEAILTNIIDGDGRARSNRSRRWWVGGGAVAAVGLATAAFAMVRSEPVRDPTGITCMATADPDGDRVGLPASDDPGAACAELWANGTLGNEQPPSLTVCVNDAGAAVVFPAGSSVCNRVGFAEQEPTTDDRSQRIVELQTALVEALAERCFTQADAVEEAQRQLDTVGLGGWTVSVPEPFDTSGQCAAPGVDVDNEQVVLVGAREP